MNRMLVKYALLLSLAVGGAYLGYGIIHKITHKKRVNERVARLPAFRFTDLEGRPFTARHLKNKPTWLLYVDSGCEFCRMELRDIQKHQQQLANVEVVLVSAEDRATLQKFQKEQGFDDLKNFHIVQDKTHECHERLGMVSTPSSLLYDAQGALIQRFSGVVKVEKIVSLLLQNPSML
ncbi:peroxiredoxin family protein [Runella slithyformis]|nr:TlpA disulfide reductase family protein [Runella slithyformis]